MLWVEADRFARRPRTRDTDGDPGRLRPGFLTACVSELLVGWCWMIRPARMVSKHLDFFAAVPGPVKKSLPVRGRPRWGGRPLAAGRGRCYPHGNVDRGLIGAAPGWEIWAGPAPAMIAISKAAAGNNFPRAGTAIPFQMVDEWLMVLAGVIGHFRWSTGLSSVTCRR